MQTSLSSPFPLLGKRENDPSAHCWLIQNQQCCSLSGAVLCFGFAWRGLSETAASRGRKKNPLRVLFLFQIKENMILEFCTKIIVIFFILQAPLKFIFTVPILKPLQRNCLWGLFDVLLKKIKNRWVFRHLHLSF